MRPEVVKIRKGRAKKTPVAVLLVTFNALEVTRKTLELLREQTLPHNVILVDNNSEDGSFQELSRAFPEVTILLAKQNYGGAGGYFLAQEYAWKQGFRFFIMADNDAYPVSQNMLEVLVDHCRTEPMTVFIPENQRVRKTGLLFHYGVIEKNLVEKAGFVDYDYFFRADDYAYGQKLRAVGARFVVLRDIHYHHHLTGFFRSPFPVYLMVRNRLRVKLVEGLLPFSVTFLLRNTSYLTAKFFFRDANLAQAYHLGIVDFIFARFTLKRTLSVVKRKWGVFNHTFSGTASFKKRSLRPYKNDALMTPVIHKYIFGETPKGLIRFFLPRKKLFTITYASGSILPALFAKRVYFLKGVDYEKDVFTFFVEENRTPYLPRLLLGMLFFLISALLLPPALFLHVVSRIAKRKYFAQHQKELEAHFVH